MKKKTRSAQIIMPYFYPVAAGMEINVLETYSVLLKKGWDITIHTSRDTLAKKNSLPATGEIRGIKIIRYKMNKLGFMPRLDWGSDDFICMHNFDIFPYIYILFYSLFLKILGRKKYSLLLIPHGGLTPDWSIYPKSRVIFRKIAYKVIGMLLINNLVDGIRAVSNWEKSELKKLGIKSSLVRAIPNGLEDAAFKDESGRASLDIRRIVVRLRKYIIQVGRIDRQKNYETMIRALVKLPSNIKFVIVGPSQDKKYKDKLEILVTQLGLENRVEFLGEITGDDKYYLLRKSQMMVHMAFWESFCNVVHEGLSQGVVCIVSNKTALPYLISDGENGFCLEARNHHLLARKIKYVLANRKSAAIKNLRLRAKKYTIGHTWRNVAEELAVYYESTNGRNKMEVNYGQN